MVRLGFLPPADAVEGDIEQDAAVLAANLAQWDQVAPKDRLLIGLTATPNRTDGVGLAEEGAAQILWQCFAGALEAGVLSRGAQGTLEAYKTLVHQKTVARRADLRAVSR